MNRNDIIVIGAVPFILYLLCLYLTINHMQKDSLFATLRKRDKISSANLNNLLKKKCY